MFVIDSRDIQETESVVIFSSGYPEWICYGDVSLDIYLRLILCVFFISSPKCFISDIQVQQVSCEFQKLNISHSESFFLWNSSGKGM